MFAPGMTGLWQVSGRSELTFDETVMLDIYYIENWSPWLDLWILVKTIPSVLTACCGADQDTLTGFSPPQIIHPDVRDDLA